MKAKPLMKVDEARTRILASMPLMPGEEISIINGLGRITHGDIISRRTQPPLALSSMDGYAVRFSDVQEIPSKLTRVGSAPAGRAYPNALNRNEAVRIFTGGPIPVGADTIVIQENVDAESENDGANLQVNQQPTKGQYIRSAGLDFQMGELGIKAGRKLTARDIGLAAAMNVPWMLSLIHI